ncbi:unnamed protein product [Mycena citricolor]|uniref:Protein kinase domain-containing protein n=1 Tax=Mycena citricolor TaxID=2018698 RepID=A0AAD2H0P0_9AGAR|nr:unnamed protein product [Mycena citricolor]
MADETHSEKDPGIPFSLDEYEDRLVPEFRMKDRLAFWDGPIRAFLREHGYVLYHMRSFPEYDVDSLMYPALETPDGPDDDEATYALMDLDSPEREMPDPEDESYLSLRHRAYAREVRGRAAFAQSAARPDRHFAIKLVRAESVEIHTIKLIYEASKEKPVRGLIPVIELIPFRGHWLVVMPRWGEEVFLPFPTVARPVYDLIEDLLEGLAFLHSHNIVHRDHCARNIAVNHIPVLTYEDLRDLPPTRQAARNAGVLRHAIFDFDVALAFPNRSSARLPWMEFYRGPIKGTHDVRQGEYDFDPFAADMVILGRVLDDSLRSFIPHLPILAPLIDGMRHWHVPSRLTASQALSLLRSLRAENRSLERQQLPAKDGMGSRKADRWEGLPSVFVSRWGHLRTPPEPWTRTTLRRLCEYGFLEGCIRFVRRSASLLQKRPRQKPL